MQRAQKKGWQACCKQYKRIQLRIHETVRVWLACMCMCMCVHISEKQTWRPFLFFGLMKLKFNLVKTPLTNIRDSFLNEELI